MGDLNVHHATWLRHSSKNTTEGYELHRIMKQSAMKEMVRKPTRGDALLDLVFTNMPHLVTTEIVPNIADHSGILTIVNIIPNREPPLHRCVWNYNEAKWGCLQKQFEDTDWIDSFHSYTDKCNLSVVKLRGWGLFSDFS